MSPSARGLVPGLFLAIVAAFAVLGVNDSWLLPALDDDGVAFWLSAPALAAGEAPPRPVSSWTDGEGEGLPLLEERGGAMPLTMAALMRSGARSHVTAVWVLAGAAALTLFALAWVVGGVAGVWGAVVAGVMAMTGPLSVEQVTAVRPEVVVTALTALLLGALTYKPGWSLLHGLVAALAWLAHPVGLGVVVAVILWPLWKRGRASGRSGWRAVAAAAPVLALFAAGGLVDALLAPPWPRGDGVLPGLAATRHGFLAWAGAGLPGVPGELFGLALLLPGTILVWLEARRTPEPEGEVHWSDAAAPDVLARTFRPAALLLAVALLLAAVLTGGGALERQWAPATLPVTALGAAGIVRWIRRERGPMATIWGVALTVWILLEAVGAFRAAASIREEGRGHTAAVWVESDVIRWLDNRSRNVDELYASDPYLVVVQTGRAVRTLPTDPAARMDAFAEAFTRRPGALLLTGPRRDDAALRYRQSLDMVTATSTREGIVLVPEPAAGPGGEAQRP